jgi:hypothetical protein
MQDIPAKGMIGAHIDALHFLLGEYLTAALQDLLHGGAGEAQEQDALARRESVQHALALEQRECRLAGSRPANDQYVTFFVYDRLAFLADRKGHDLQDIR